MRKKAKEKLEEVIEETIEITLIERIKNMSIELDRLTASVTALNTKVDALIAAQVPPDTTTGPALIALADSVDAEAVKVDAALPKP